MDRRKILMIFGGAWLSAAVLTWFVFSRMTSPKVEKLTTIYAASRDLPAGTRLRKGDVKQINLPGKDMPRAAITDEAVAVDRVLLHPINTNEPLVTTKLTSSQGAEGVASIIEAGKRAISVPVTDLSGAGGLIQPRSRVDVLFTRTGTMKEAVTTTILQDVVVLSIGKFTEAGQIDPKANRPQTQAATLMVAPEDANKIELAKNQGKISLILRNPLDKSYLETSSVTAEALDPNLYSGAARAIRGSMIASGKIPDIRNDKVWADLTGKQPAESAKKEPPKPRLVVDVYRGDKHVQEIFQ